MVPFTNQTCYDSATGTVLLEVSGGAGNNTCIVSSHPFLLSFHCGFTIIEKNEPAKSSVLIYHFHLSAWKCGSRG